MKYFGTFLSISSAVDGLKIQLTFKTMKNAEIRNFLRIFENPFFKFVKFAFSIYDSILIERLELIRIKVIELAKSQGG